MNKPSTWQQVRMLILLALCLWGLYLFAWRRLQFFEVPSKSMEPTLLVGDRIATMREAVYHRGDIIVFWDADEGEHLVKRIVGLPGDTIMVTGGALTINTHFASEPYIAEVMEGSLDSPVRVGEGEYFVMGDNRNHSYDSSVTRRAVPHEEIVGKVHFLYYPFERAGMKRSYPLINVVGD